MLQYNKADLIVGYTFFKCVGKMIVTVRINNGFAIAEQYTWLLFQLLIQFVQVGRQGQQVAFVQ
ncbi:hypothetical protein D3C87_2176050 [compost metagenome]